MKRMNLWCHEEQDSLSVLERLRERKKEREKEREIEREREREREIVL